ncbi:MAG: hypothetical protein MSD82_00295 [Prevotella sp.]|nr:hypothetical protein [Prevotella sp.]
MTQKSHQTRKILLSWLLIAVFLPQIAVKALHTCESGQPAVYGLTPADGAQLNHSNADCPICHYAFQPLFVHQFFTPDVTPVVYADLIPVCYLTRPYACSIDTPGLRAPPAKAC